VHHGHIGWTPWGSNPIERPRLWVRETFGQFWGGVHYRATDDRPDLAECNWKPSIFMPRALCRLLLDITAIRVERLQEIPGRDIQAEGIWLKDCEGRSRPRDVWSGAFAATWDELNAARGYSWESNPWVWVISFKPVTG